MVRSQAWDRASVILEVNNSERVWLVDDSVDASGEANGETTLL